MNEEIIVEYKGATIKADIVWSSGCTGSGFHLHIKEPFEVKYTRGVRWYSTGDGYLIKDKSIDDCCKEIIIEEYDKYLNDKSNE